MTTQTENDANPYLNIAAYHFVDLDEPKLPALKEDMKDKADELNIVGSILLSTEGVNIFLSATEAAIEAWWSWITAKPEFAALVRKDSWSRKPEFRKMIVKIKKEIIPIGMDHIRPKEHTGARISAEELKKWYDEGKEFVILDTRNIFEFEVGTFKNAIHLNLERFRDFPSALDQLNDEMKQKPIVTFCTGGIRCEKATPVMEEQGFEDVYQLDGGILKYFEHFGDEHYDGECFVFDRRVAVDGDLQPTKTEVCYRCRHPLTLADQASEKYIIGVCCPYCYEKNGRKYTPPQWMIDEAEAADEDAATSE